MEDPWSSPWTTERTARDNARLPPEPKQPDIQTPLTPRFLTPWSRDPGEGSVDGAWRSWDDADPGGDASATWSASLPLGPTGRERATARLASADAWGLSQGAANHAARGEGADSAVGVGEEALLGDAASTVMPRSEGGSDPLHPAGAEDGAWVEDEKPEPPERAFGSKGGGEANRQACGVQEPAEKYNGTDKDTLISGLSRIDAAGKRDVVDQVAAEDDTDLPAASRSAPAAEPPATPRPARCPIDLSQLDALFPGVPCSSNGEHHERPHVADEHAFTSASQRSAWHRLSRLGSLRRHGSSQGENYVRVSWANSQTRKDTLLHVRRWMGAHPAAGPAALGAARCGRAGASLFNWDTGGPCIKIDELLLGRKQEQSRSRGRQLSAGLDATTTTTTTTTSPTAVSSGWSAGGPASAVRNGVEESGRAHEQPPGEPTGVEGTANRAPAETADELSGRADDDDDDDDDEDDWGEMVSCPREADPLGRPGMPAARAGERSEHGHQPGGSGASDSGVVESIVRGLPDLSYMMK